MESSITNPNFIFADEGYCWATADESQIYKNYIYVEDENDLKKYHQITLQRAKEIEEAYYKKYINIP